MKKPEMLALLHELETTLGIARHQYVLSSGAALMLLGLREEISDIDLSVGGEVWYDLLEKGYQPSPGIRCPVIPFQDADIHLDKCQMLLDQMIVEGIHILDPRELLAEKLRMNRDKDQADIRNLREYLETYQPPPF